MENRAVTLQITLTRKTLVGLAAALLLAAALVAGGVALAQMPDQPEDGLRVTASEYDEYLYPKLPRQMNYQGVLTNDDGNPIDGTHDLTLTIYERDRLDLAWTWKAVYSETQEVQVTNGLFNVVIGATKALNPGDFDGLSRQLLISTGGELELGVSVDLSLIHI